ncbi:hypothetical protein [Streptomyces sp. NPDC059063]|uniref:hypothetical protein n=1 Tax=unclassified Streptomyces TaxID=2593676 RepID=UPI00367F5173
MNTRPAPATAPCVFDRPQQCGRVTTVTAALGVSRTRVPYQEFSAVAAWRGGAV